MDSEPTPQPEPIQDVEVVPNPTESPLTSSPRSEEINSLRNATSADESEASTPSSGPDDNSSAQDVEVEPRLAKPPAKLPTLAERMAELRSRRKKASEGHITNTVGHYVSLEEIDRALVKFHGDRGKAAKSLNLKRITLNTKVNQCKWLKERWCKYRMSGPNIGLNKPEVPNEISTLSRESPVVVDKEAREKLKTEAELAAAIAREDKKIKDGLHLMGATGEEQELAISLKSFHGRHLKTLVEMMTSGMALNSLKMLGLLRRIEGRIAAGCEPGNELAFKCNERGDPVEERLAFDEYRGLLEEFRRMNELAIKGSLTLAKIQQIKNEGGKVGGPGKKLGFKPKGENTTNIVAQNVTLNP